MTEALLIIVLLVTLINAFLTYMFNKGNKNEGYIEVLQEIKRVGEGQQKLESMVREEVSRNREELLRSVKDNRDDLNTALKNFGDTTNNSLNNSLKTATEQQNEKLSIFSAQLDKLNSSINENLREHRTTLQQSLESFEQKIGKLRDTIDNSLKEIREDTNRNLEKMRQTVDEELHKTLEERLDLSFKSVTDKLESVHKGLGEMRELASDVGGLKKVLSNVKTRGVLGEYQLESILEDVLTPNQFGKNVKTNPNTREHVEFALKLPGQDSDNKEVYLPIDSKFPIEPYNRLIDAYETADVIIIESALKELHKSIKGYAKDITKYIDPPNTTDFAIMFLPVEGLYAEVLRSHSLFDSIRRDFNIIITGPTTLSAILSSLQMGFRTLAIQKRSSEVWKILAAVKTEFGKFGEIIDKTQTNLSRASDNLRDLVGVRTRAIQKKLKQVEILPEKESLETLKLDDIVSNDGEE